MYEPGKLKHLVEDRCAGPKPFTLESLIAWLEKMPSDGKYDYLDGEKCLLGQYTSAQGGVLAYPFYKIGHNRVGTNDTSGPHRHLYQVAYLHTGADTFGAALERALHLQATSPRSCAV